MSKAGLYIVKAEAEHFITSDHHRITVDNGDEIVNVSCLVGGITYVYEYGEGTMLTSTLEALYTKTEEK